MAGSDDLYGLPLDEFTGARDALARRLRAEGRPSEAAEVASLRKPVLPAWAVNVVVRRRAADVRRAVDAAAAIRAGRNDGDERFRKAIDALLRAAREVLAEAGREPSDAVLRQVSTTLRAAAAEDPAALRAGRFTQPLEPSGFEAMAGAAVRRRPARAPDRARSRAARAAAVAEARRALTEARSEARRLGREAERAARETDHLRARADEAAREVAAAEKRLAEARTG